MSDTPKDTVLDGVTLTGTINIDAAQLIANVSSAIRRGYPQVHAMPMRPERVVILGGGPSLADSVDEIRELLWSGAKLVTCNGTYRWAIDHGFKPSAQIVLDARASNARFVVPEVPDCRYFLASQVHPDVWDAVAGYTHVAIWHDESEQAVIDLLDAYYMKRWQGIPGGTTVGTRAIGLMRTLGYLRFDLFGFDSCWTGDAHHAYPQAENDQDRRYRLSIHPSGRPDLAREFTVSGWHVKQLEDLLHFIKASGDSFLLNIHGDGLLAYALRAQADVEFTTSEG